MAGRESRIKGTTPVKPWVVLHYCDQPQIGADFFLMIETIYDTRICDDRRLLLFTAAH
jgi:hypothetical protein